MARSWVLVLPYTKPPLSMNSRLHHMKRYRLEQEVIADTMWLVRAKKVPALAACTVQLHYRPVTNNRRDTDNLMALLKPVADGLTRAGVVPDDTPEFMARPEPIIHPWARLAYPTKVLWVEVTETLVYPPEYYSSADEGGGS